MKKALQLAFGVLAIAAVSSCNAIKDNVPAQNVDFTGASADFIIPATSDTTAQGTLATTVVSYNIDSLIRDKTSGAMSSANIRTVKISSVVLSLTDADPKNNFGNFTYAAFTFNTNAAGTQGNPYTLANIENNPAVYNANMNLPLLEADKDLKQYFSGNNLQFTYAYIAKLRKKTDKMLHCHAEVKYDIEVKL